jgi:hypothetical protein
MTMPTVDEFLESYSPAVREMALKARELVMSVAPELVEQIDVPGKLLGYGWDTTYAGTVCVIMPLKDSLNLGFARGASLPDPDKLLEGTGKRARHIKFRTLEALDAPAVRALLEAVVQVGK